MATLQDNFKNLLAAARGLFGNQTESLTPHREEDEVNFAAFKPVHVFDVSQTNGRELPVIAAKLTGSVEEFDRLLQTLCEVSPCPISIVEIDGAANGYYDPSDNIIVIKTGLSQEQTVKTAIHEMAHALLGHGEDESIDRRTGEVQAESVAYMTCQHLGIDSSQYTFGYLANWSGSKELPELQTSLELIQKIFSELIAKIDDKLDRQRELEPRQEVQQLQVERFVFQADASHAEVMYSGNLELFRVQLDGEKHYIAPPSGRVELTQEQVERYKDWHGKLIDKQGQLLSCYSTQYGLHKLIAQLQEALPHITDKLSADITADCIDKLCGMSNEEYIRLLQERLREPLVF